MLAGTRQVDAALKSVATASTTTAQATQKLDQAAKTAGQSMTTEGKAAQGAAQQTAAMQRAADAAAQAMGQNLATAVAAAAQSMIQAERDAKKAEAALRQAAKEAEDLARAAAAAANPLGALGSKIADFGRQAGAFGLAQAGVESLQAALRTTLDFATGSVRAAVQTESLTAAFKAIEGSGQAAGQTMQWLKDQANRLGVDVVALSTGFKTVDAAARGTSLQGEGIRQVFVSMAEASRVLGLSSQDLSGVLLAVGQSISKGTVQAEELRGQVGERLPGAFQIAARAMGVTTAELDKMMERGEIQATTFWPRFAAVIQRDFGGSVEEASKTAGAAFARFDNSVRDLQINVGKYLIPALMTAVDWFNRVAAAADSSAGEIGKMYRAMEQFDKEGMTLPGAEARRDELVDIQKQLAAEQSVYGTQNMEERERKIAALEERRTEILKAQAEELKKLTDRRREYLDLEASSGPGTAPMVPGEGTRQKVLGYFKELEAAQAVIDRQVQAGMPARDALNARVKLFQETLTKAREEEAKLPGTLAIVQKALQPQIDTAQKQLGIYQDQIKAIDGVGKARAKAASEEGKAQREAEAQYRKDLATSLKTDEPFLQQVSDAADLLGELQRRTLALRHTEEERFAMRVEAMLKERPYLEDELTQAMKAYEQAKTFNDALRERNKLLQDQAQASKETLDDLTRLMQQLEPSRRSMTTEERLAGTRAEIAKRTDDPGWLARADAQIRETLDAEAWDEWRDAGLDAMDDLSSALTDFVFTGKSSLTDLANHAVQQFFRMASEQTFRAAFNSDTAQGLLKAGLSLVGAVAGGGGSTGAFVGGDAPGMQHGGTVYGGRPYWVGEAGPELVVPRQTSTVIPHGQSMALAAPNVTVVVQGVTDASSFLQSQGAVQRGVARAIAAAQRAM